MGCDIHTIVEVRRGKKWELHNGVWLCYACDGDGPWRPIRGQRECYACNNVGRSKTPWRERNYDVFGMLAGVRTDDWKVISNERDFPSDMSFVPDVDATDDDAWWPGDHSYGWVTLAELHAYDWWQTVTKSGVVGMTVFARWDHVTPPVSYSGGVSGPSIKHLTAVEARAWLAKHDPPPTSVEPFDPTNIYVDDCEWRETAAQCAGNFLTFVAEMTNLARRVGVDNDDVRLVFGFDS